jgi:hypothetical protein
MSGKELNQEGRCVGGGTQARIERIEEKDHGTMGRIEEVGRLILFRIDGMREVELNSG